MFGGSKPVATLAWGAGVLVAASIWTGARPPEPPRREASLHAAVGGVFWFEFDQPTLDELGWEVFPHGNLFDPARSDSVFSLEPSGGMRVERSGARAAESITGRVRSQGALLLLGAGERVVIANFSIGPDARGLWTVRSELDDATGPVTPFKLTSVVTAFSPPGGDLQIVGELLITQNWAQRLGMPELAGIVIGTVTVDVELQPLRPKHVSQAADDNRGTTEGDEAGEPGTTAALIGPDILVADLHQMYRFGRAGDITAFGVGTNACNIGDRRANWVQLTNQHPVIFSSMYRLHDGRYEEIGMSWVKHGFYALSQSLCGPCLDPTGGSQLGVGCSDPYTAYLNGAQTNMSRRSDVNAHSGYFPYPWTAPPVDPVIGKRLQVHDADLDPALNDGAMYFVQGHYIAADDAAAENDNNNASYRRVNVQVEGPDHYNVVLSGAWPTQRGQAGIRAWKDYDPEVVETDVQVPDEGLFILAAKATDLGTGFWHYEYALQNLNSDRSAGSFSIPVAAGTAVQNIGFHDVDYHSGEIYDLTDWSATVDNGLITWSTERYDVDPNANALRFSTLYNFRFDANVSSEPATAVIGLFKPHDPPDVAARTIGPAACASTEDSDGDGVIDCFDLCPDTPPGKCTCPLTGLCCWGSVCLPDYPRDACIADGGTPECPDPPCKSGCLLGDGNNDGEHNLVDIQELVWCFSGEVGEPGHTEPSQKCVNLYDVNGDGTVDLDDYKELFRLFAEQ